MTPQTLSIVRAISDASLADSADVFTYIAEDAERQAGRLVETFISDRGPCVVSPLTRRELPQRDPFLLGRTYEFRQHIMPIVGATDDDWREMRRRCNLEP